MKNTSLQKNSAVQLSIESLASDGAGVAHAGGMAVLVPFAAPGDVVDAKIVKVCKTHAFAIVQNVITPGPGRIAPECPVFGKCGGCALAHLTYEEELAQKQRFVADAMHRIGKLSCEVLPILTATRRSTRFAATAKGISAPGFTPRAATVWCPARAAGCNRPFFPPFCTPRAACWNRWAPAYTMRPAIRALCATSTCGTPCAQTR